MVTVNIPIQKEDGQWKQWQTAGKLCSGLGVWWAPPAVMAGNTPGRDLGLLPRNHFTGLSSLWPLGHQPERSCFAHCMFLLCLKSSLDDMPSVGAEQNILAILPVVIWRVNVELRSQPRFLLIQFVILLKVKFFWTFFFSYFFPVSFRCQFPYLWFFTRHSSPRFNVNCLELARVSWEGCIHCFLPDTKPLK